MREKVDKVNQRGGAVTGRRRERGAPVGSEIGELLHALTHRMRRHLRHAARGLPDGLTPMQWRALGYFARHPGASSRDLVEHAGRDKAQVARLVRSLVAEGLLAATPSPSDQRSQCLALTEAGEALHRQLAHARRRIDAALLAGLDLREQQQLVALLTRLHESLGEP